MSAETKFRCDICRNDIKADGFATGEAFAFKWASDDSLTTQGASPYRDAPIHLCRKCIHAVFMWLKKQT